MNTELLQETDFHCPLCGEPLPSYATEVTKCDWVPGYQQEEPEMPSNPHDTLALVMSLVLPGAGHYFKGYRVLGAFLLLLGVPVIGMFAFAFTMFFGWLLLPCYWLAVAADAYLRKDLQPTILPAQKPV